MNRAQVERAVRGLLVALQRDVDSEALAGTPNRVARAWEELLAGYGQDPAEVMRCTGGAEGFEQHYDGMVVLAGLPFTSTCEHHLLPFVGTADVAYIPGPSGRVVGLSKLARLVDVYARRLQLQERLTTEVATALATVTEAAGVGVRFRAVHQCMVCRGVRKAGTMSTQVLLGCFREHEVRAEFWQLANQKEG